MGLQLGLISSHSCSLFPLPSRMLCIIAQLGLKDPAFLVDVDFLFFFSFLKSCLLFAGLQTQENLATVLTGVMVPAGAVTQPLPSHRAGQWLVPARLPCGQFLLQPWLPSGLAAASPTGEFFKPPLAGLQVRQLSPGLHQAPPPPSTTFPARVFAMLDSEPARPSQTEALESGSGAPGPTALSCCHLQDSGPRHHAGPASLSSPSASCLGLPSPKRNSPLYDSL